MSYRYSPTARILHWLTVLLVAVMLGLGFAIVYVVPEHSPWSHRLFNTHESLGLVVLAVMILRLLYRFADPPPPLPDAVPRVYHRAGHANHVLLYTLLIAQPVIGLIGDNASGFQLNWFDIAPLPMVIGKHDALAQVMAAAHWYVGMAITLLVCAHIGGALFHAVVRRDGVLQRMW